MNHVAKKFWRVHVLHRAQWNDHYHVNISQSLHNHGLEVGDQVRIGTNHDNLALFTIQSILEEDHDSTMDKTSCDHHHHRVQLNGKRIGLDQDQKDCELSGPSVVMLKQQPQQQSKKDKEEEEEFCDQSIKEQSEFVEQLNQREEKSGKEFLFLALHGGDMEAFTAQQVELLGNSIPCTTYVCKGYRKGGGAFNRWHITSSELSIRSFPKLNELANHQPKHEYCISFHGMSKGGILIGGLASSMEKELLQSILLQEIEKKNQNDDKVIVRIAESHDLYNGMSVKNPVNWLTESGTGGIQLEQDRTVRSKYWKEIVKSVIVYCSNKKTSTIIMHPVL